MPRGTFRQKTHASGISVLLYPLIPVMRSKTEEACR